MDPLKQLIQWAVPIGVCIGILLVFLMIKRILFSRLSKWSQKTTVRWDDILIRSLRLPFNLLILVAALWISQHFVKMPKAFMDMTDAGAKLLVILACLYFFDRFFVGLLRTYAEKNVVLLSSQKLIATAIHLIAFSFTALLILSAMGISITPFIASLGIGSMAIALALQDTLVNAFSGMHLMIDKPIGKGDYIGLDDGHEGFVEAVGWRSTRLRLFSNNSVIIPNSKLSGSVITNYEMPNPQASVKVECGVHYDSDLDQVERVVVEEAKKIMKEHPAGVAGFDPIVRFKAFSDSSIDFYVILRSKRHVEHYGMKSEFIKNLHKRFNQEGIVIPFPIRTVYLQKNA